jgi:hypothetical protein
VHRGPDDPGCHRVESDVPAADGIIDLAVCWVPADELGPLDARLLRADRMFAVSVGTDSRPVRARDTVVLIDTDEASWSSWNRWALAMADGTGARAVSISDGGLTGPAFFEPVRRLGRPVVSSCKGQGGPLPSDLMARPIVRPAPYWAWSLVSRRDEERPAVRATIEALTGSIADAGLDDPETWLPPEDPHRRTAA